jgi:putative FmdB family regulatory protein
MPLYEYLCQSCGKRTEVIQSFREKPLKICPHCGKRTLKKLLSAPAIQFKGSGWYVTDYAGKKGGKAKPAEGSSAESGKTEAKEKPAESKTEAKKETKKTE